MSRPVTGSDLLPRTRRLFADSFVSLKRSEPLRSAEAPLNLATRPIHSEVGEKCEFSVFQSQSDVRNVSKRVSIAAQQSFVLVGMRCADSTSILSCPCLFLAVNFLALRRLELPSLSGLKGLGL